MARHDHLRIALIPRSSVNLDSIRAGRPTPESFSLVAIWRSKRLTTATEPRRVRAFSQSRRRLQLLLGTLPGGTGLNHSERCQDVVDERLKILDAIHLAAITTMPNGRSVNFC